MTADKVWPVAAGILIGMAVSRFLRPPARAPRIPGTVFNLPDKFPSSTSGPYMVVAEQSSGNKIRDIKAIRACTHRGLAESKQLTDNMPSLIAENVSMELAADVQGTLQQAGMTVRITRATEMEG